MTERQNTLFAMATALLFGVACGMILAMSLTPKDSTEEALKAIEAKVLELTDEELGTGPRDQMSERQKGVLQFSWQVLRAIEELRESISERTKKADSL